MTFRTTVKRPDRPDIVAEISPREGGFWDYQFIGFKPRNCRQRDWSPTVEGAKKAVKEEIALDFHLRMEKVPRLKWEEVPDSE